MKKILALLLAAAMLLSLNVCAFANEGDEESCLVIVDIVVGGEFAVADDNYIMATVLVEGTDLNGNGYVDIDDILTIVHEEYMPGGYASEMGDWGLAITKLWGDESGAFGYYVDNASAWSLEDPVYYGSKVVAFVYADQETWSDVYTYFDTEVTDDGIVLTLNALGYDEAWNPVAIPVEGAQLCTFEDDGTLVAIDDAITDENGQVCIFVEEGYGVIVTAVIDDCIYVPASEFFYVAPAEA